jgi:hypothetical protein
MAGPDPAIHANTTRAEIAWMLGSSPSMTVVVRAGMTVEVAGGMTVVVLQPDRP